MSQKSKKEKIIHSEEESSEEVVVKKKEKTKKEEIESSHSTEDENTSNSESSSVKNDSSESSKEASESNNESSTEDKKAEKKETNTKKSKKEVIEESEEDSDHDEEESEKESDKKEKAKAKSSKDGSKKTSKSKDDDKQKKRKKSVSKAKEESEEHSENDSDKEEVILSPRSENRPNATKLFFRVVEVQRKPKNYFAVIEANGKKLYKSSTTKKSTVWNDEGRLLPIPEDTVNFKVTLYEKGILRTAIGSIILNFDELVERYPYNRWYQIEGKKDKKSYLHLQIMILPPNQALGQEFSLPLHTFIKEDRYDLFKDVVEEQFTDTEATDGEGNSAIHCAAELNKLKYLKLLLKKVPPKIAAGLKSNNGNTALHTACLHKASKDVIEFLLSNKFDPNATNNRKETPLHCASECDNHEAIEVLVAKGANINAQDEEGNVPLSVALLKHSPNAIKALLKAKANVFKKIKKGMTVWELAQRRDLVNTEPRKVFMEQLGVHDAREFPELKKFPKKFTAEGKKISIDYLESTQFTITSKTQMEVSILISSPELSSEFASQSSFALTKSQQGIHNEPDYSRDTIAFGGAKAVHVTIEPEYFYTIIPYAKMEQFEGGYVVVVRTEEDKEVTITELKPWKYCEVVEGRWKKKTAGGALHNETWVKNTQYELTLPKQDNVRFLVYLAQEPDDIEYRLPDGGELSVVPYDFNIGFVLLDKNGTKAIDQTEKFSNSRGVHKEFVLNCKENNVWTIVPATWNPGEESEFTLKVYCDEPISLKMK